MEVLLRCWCLEDVGCGCVFQSTHTDLNGVGVWDGPCDECLKLEIQSPSARTNCWGEYLTESLTSQLTALCSVHQLVVNLAVLCWTGSCCGNIEMLNSFVEVWWEFVVGSSLWRYFWTFHTVTWPDNWITAALEKHYLFQRETKLTQR